MRPKSARLRSNAREHPRRKHSQPAQQKQNTASGRGSKQQPIAVVTLCLKAENVGEVKEQETAEKRKEQQALRDRPNATCEWLHERWDLF